MLLLVDNYDSFTYNLQDYFSQLHHPCTVFRNDEKSIDEVAALQPSALIFSPGPEIPSRAGIMMDLIGHFHDKIPLLGICLGHQGIGEFFGAKLVRTERPIHGKTSMISYKPHPLFSELPNPFQAMRYHSLVLKDVEQTILQSIAFSENGEVMAVVHPRYLVCGIQFHPESILTPHGITILSNWLQWVTLK
jgi:anthranilate synthase/aminodeoxychorismate synthase-like glutamine amidotransferase